MKRLTGKCYTCGKNIVVLQDTKKPPIKSATCECGERIRVLSSFIQNEKNYCWLCKHIRVSSGWGGSEVTPGDPAELECDKKHWNLFSGGMYSGDGKTLRDCIMEATNCPDFELGRWVGE